MKEFLFKTIENHPVLVTIGIFALGILGYFIKRWFFKENGNALIKAVGDITAGGDIITGDKTVIDRNNEEIKELNKKMHDRLVEIDEAVESNTKPENYTKIKTRLHLNASRLKKYDKTIFEDVDRLLKILSSNEKEGAVVTSNEASSQIKSLTEQIKGKVDKLWLYR